PLRVAALFFGPRLDAEQPVDSDRPERQSQRLRLLRIRVRSSPRDRPARPFGDQPCHSIRADPRDAALLALLETEAGFGAKPEPLSGPADAHGVEDRGLDDDVPGRLGNLAGGGAHDPRDRQWAARVGDDQRLRCQLTVDVVERLEALPWPGGADDEPSF